MNTRPNPYVGPRAFQPGEPFYGRDRELRSLSALLIAERIILLHSPSGSGKTSLIQAGLLPRLREENFNVLPIIRVNAEVPESVSGLMGVNRYALSTLLSLEEALPEAERRPVAELAALTLDEYLTQRPRGEAAPVSDVLIFDQFEEVLTYAPTDRESKLIFFEQLGKALRNKDRWALVAIREDYLGALAPYTRPIPGRLGATFRLDLLGVDGALQAIQKPAQASSVNFLASAAAKLVDDLRRIHVQLPDGSLEEQLGLHVEPVQLQVVCYRLWQGLADDDVKIDESDLAGVGDVNRALADYYAASAQAVAQKSGASEREIREWFDHKLITPEGIRGQVLMGAENSDGLPNRVVGLLEDAHIIRGEKRAGKTWFELSHDRMIKPVRENNAAWFSANLSLFQQQAVLWTQQGKSDGLLLRGKELAQAEGEAKTLNLTADEQSFLEACRKLRQREQRDRRRNTTMTILAIGATIAMIVAGIFFFRAEASAEEAKKVAGQNAELAHENANVAATAEAAQATAVMNANIAHVAEGTAQAAQATAVINANIAQVNLARSEGLLMAVNASALLSIPDGSPELAALLSLQSIKRSYTTEGDNALLTSLTRPWPIRRIIDTKEFSDVAFSPDSATMAAVGDDPAIRLWNVSDGKLALTLTGHTQPNTRVVFSPDGKYLLTGSSDGTARFWDLATATTKSLLSGHKASINDVAISADGHLAATASSDKTVRIWDLSNVTHPTLILNQGSEAYSVAFAPKGRSILVGLGNGKIYLWNALSGARMLTFTGHTRPVYSIVFSSDGRYALSGSGDKLAILWDIAAGKAIYTFFGHADSVDSVAFSPDHNYVLTSSWDKTVRLWSLATGQLVRMYTGHFGQTRGAAFSPNGEWIATVSLDKSVLLWDSWFHHQPKAFTNHTDWVYSVAYSPDGRSALSGSRDKTLRYWDIQSGTEIRAFTGHTGTVASVSFSPDGKRALSASADKSARVWDLTTGKQILRLNGHTAGLLNAAYSHSGQYIATASYDKTAILWDATTGTQIRSFTHGDTVMHVTFSPDDRLLATGSFDTLIRLWDVQTGAQLKTFTGHTGWVWSVEFSPDGKYLLSAGTDSTVRLWDVTTGKELRQFIGPTDWAYNVAFSPDGRYVAAGGREKLAWIWETATGTLVRTLAGHTGGIIGLDFDPDGQHVMTGGFDTIVRVWPVNYQDSIADACKRLTRDLTDQERAVYKLPPQEPSCTP
jgi:WD40 repeat protein